MTGISCEKHEGSFVVYYSKVQGQPALMIAVVGIIFFDMMDAAPALDVPFFSSSFIRFKIANYTVGYLPQIVIYISSLDSLYVSTSRSIVQ